jgi:demethylmenaquinone methyltransferase/2-methoxy-6-polyprenyl-1,4-benzoquinol methylase
MRAGSSPVGVDFSAGMLAAAHTRAPLARADALELPLPDASADGVVSGFALRNFVDLARFFRECARVLRPGGRVATLETGEPVSPLLRAGHNLWFRRVVPFVGARLAHDAEAYEYLPRSTAYLPPPDDLVALVEAACFVAVERRTFTAGAVQLVTGTRR